MQIRVVQNRFAERGKQPEILLVRTPWDDHDYRTMFRAFYVSSDAEEPPTPLGRVKILQRGRNVPELPSELTQLDASFCSLGQEPEYYARLHDRRPADAIELLHRLRDLAVSPQIEQEFKEEPGFRLSLLRFPNAELALLRARSLFAITHKVLEAPLEFTFTAHIPHFDGPHVLDFSFPRPKRSLGRLFAIAGRNGCGKTQLLGRLGLALSGLDQLRGQIVPRTTRRVVAISFNPFDNFTRPRDNMPGDAYRYYGLRAPPSRTTEQEPHSRTSLDQALDRLKQSLRRIWTMGPEYQREWARFLDTSGIFDSEPELENVLAEPPADPTRFGASLDAFIKRLAHASSGHQFLVFVVTALVESVRQDSVVLIDEMEAHIHSRLLSTIIRLLSDFLIQRDAFAILATHSPLVLQEIPARAVRLIRLSDRYPVIKQYPGESFGESLDDILREAFGVEESDRNYASLLREMASETPDRAEIERQFNGLGLGARMLLREILEGNVS